VTGLRGDADATGTSPFDAIGTARRFKRGAVLMLQGDAPSAVHQITEGWVKIVRTTPSGSEVLVDLLGPGDLIGHFEAFEADDAGCWATVVALADTTTSAIPKEQFLEYLVEHPLAALKQLRALIARLGGAERHRLEAALFDTTHRLASQLVTLADRFGEVAEDGVSIHAAVSQDDLASMIGASRDSVARALTSLRSRDLVRTGRRMITIVDIDALRAVASEML